MECKFNVFTKEKTKKDGSTFKVRLTKNANNKTFEVRFIEECVNKHLVPKDNKPFVLVTDNNGVSASSKTIKTDDGKVYTKLILYVKNVVRIEEYVEPEFNVDAFNSVSDNDDEPLPF